VKQNLQIWEMKRDFATLCDRQMTVTGSNVMALPQVMMALTQAVISLLQPVITLPQVMMALPQAVTTLPKDNSLSLSLSLSLSPLQTK
jgi:hypothetical protein